MPKPKKKIITGNEYSKIENDVPITEAPVKEIDTVKSEDTQELIESKTNAEEPITPEDEKPKAKEKITEDEIEIVEEKILTLNLRKVWNSPRKKRAPKAVRVIRQAVEKHMKSSDIKISNDVNELVWTKGIGKPPRRIELRAVKDKEGTVIVFSGGH